MKRLLDTLLRARSGSMTDELRQKPTRHRLGMLPDRLAPAASVRSTCGYCSTGCALRIHLDESGQAINLSPDHDYPVNQGMACPKGWEALAPLSATDRAVRPLLRDAQGILRPVSWERALAVFCERMKAIQDRTHGDGLAVLSTGQIPFEEMGLLGTLARVGMGIRHLDSNTRQCMATAHVAYRQSLGFDAPPFSYEDFEESDVLVFIGANPCIAHPILWQRVMRNRRKPVIIVIDPRRTETAMQAGLHLALRPKSDLALLYGLAAQLDARGLTNPNFIRLSTSGYEEFRSFLQPYTPEATERDTGIDRDTLHKVVELLGNPRLRVSYWWTMGVNQSHQSTRTAQAIINLSLMTGQIGKPGTGANSITGQCNAMGSRLFGFASTLPGGQDFTDPKARARVAEVLGVEPTRIPAEKSIAYDQIVDGIEEGRIRGLWVVATNPAHSWIDQGRVRRLRERLEFLVVQDMYASTEIAQMADLVLPAAGWGEKEGCFINSERRISVTRRVARPPGEALSDFAIFKLIAAAWGCGELLSAWSEPEAAFRLLRELTRGGPADFTGIEGYEQLDREGGIQWPLPEGSVTPAARQRRLFEDGRFFTPDGCARFLFDTPRPLPEAPDAEYPFLLNTGRGSSAQWHTGSRTDKSAVLRKLAPKSQVVEIHPDDAARLGIWNTAKVEVRSRRGVAQAVASVTPVTQPGQLFMPMHFAEVNRLTHPSFDPHSRQPNYKACAVSIQLLT
jgi:assimilatory nitrate reductase catalytic subunit